MKRSMVFEGVAVTLLLLVSFLMLAMLLGESSEKQIGGMGQVQYIYTGNDGTLYAFMDRSIQAIDGKGGVLWEFGIPGQWKVGYGWYFDPALGVGGISPDRSSDSACNITAVAGDPIVFSNNGTLYVYLKPNTTGPAVPSSGGLMSGELMAISATGKALWHVPLESLRANFSQNGYGNGFGGPGFGDVQIYARGDRVYVFHDYNETIIDGSGRVLWNVENVSDPASVDEEGIVYLVPSRSPTESYPQPFSPYPTNFPYQDEAVNITDYRVPSAIVDAYYPNGTLYWSAYPGELVYRQYMGRNSLPLYNNGTIYAPLVGGVMALDRNGTEKWCAKLDTGDFTFTYVNGYNMTRYSMGDFRLYGQMPFDSKGNIYMAYVSRDKMPFENFSTFARGLYIIALAGDGHEVSRVESFEGKYVSAYDGIGYATSDSLHPQRDYFYFHTAESLTSLGTEQLIAYDITSGRALWNYTFPVNDPVIVTLCDNNTGEIFSSGGGETIGYNNNNGQFGRLLLSDVEVPEVVARQDGVYAYFKSRNYETPVISGQSRCAYVSGIYAFGRNGTLAWNRSVSPGAYSMSVAGNGTVFYRTGDGGLVVTGAGAATGFALTTLAYLFIRFLCLGAVARAKARMNKNDNRNKVYDFIVRNPGSTLYEISRGAGMNIGTIRYHLFILGLNHKIVSSRMDGKHIRHFTNSNTYGKEEQLILSLARRGTMGKILTLLLQKPGISNVQISRELGITESEVSRYMGELAEKGMVVKGTAGKECAYAIEDTRRQLVAGALKRLDGS